MSLKESIASSSSSSHSSPPMESPFPPPAPNAARETFLMLLASAVRRCRLSEGLCRLSIFLKGVYASDSPSIKFSDGILFVTTTCIRDKEVYRYRLNLMEQAGTAARLTKLPSFSKNGNKFSGTEVSVSMSVEEGVGEFAKWVGGLIRKVSILRIPIIAFQLKSEDINIYGSNYESIPMEIRTLQPLPSSNIERLISGLEDYVRRHGNVLGKMCQSCFSSGVCQIAHNSPGALGNIWLYFRLIEYHYCHPLLLETISSIHISSQLVGITFLLHTTSNTNPLTRNKVLPLQALQGTGVDKNLVKRAVKSGLDNLKMKHRGVFLGPRALKIQKYVPDLSRALAGLILSSNDRDFQNECALLLGLDPLDVGVEGKVEWCIREKVTRVVETSGGKEPKEGAPCLFECQDGAPDEYPSIYF
ncbi:unnamed protein product [Spirodela intermedia]|uniref:Uncharacterized protein n=1 Tax=Spirodela intermedia TaxID=51605 RepID=A0A7I8J7Z9_SPIIN|nr:unnamed protein product [Spirodela intermedia]CAA6665552.1 unnamed protein product [Spirodela intermedia]